MSFKSLLGVGVVGIIIAACGGGVSLGNVGSGSSGQDAGDDGSSGGIGTGTKECSSKSACGPLPGVASIVCPDGSTGGNTGRCLDLGNGNCAWENRTCPPDTCFVDNALDPKLKACTTSSDCVIVDYEKDCCGTTHAAGVAKSNQAKVAACAADRAKGFPACGCPTGLTGADDGTKPASATAGGGAPVVSCNAAHVCETTFKTIPCGTTPCASTQTCCSSNPIPTPTCYDSSACPVSRRAYKKDITYLEDADRQQLSDELMSFRLATYRYKSEADTDRKQLGFIIDDVAPSAAVVSSGDRVDMYGYQSMTVAALQTQAKEIAELRKQVEDLQRTCARKR